MASEREVLPALAEMIETGSEALHEVAANGGTAGKDETGTIVSLDHVSIPGSKDDEMLIRMDDGHGNIRTFLLTEIEG
jgi:hypothetical protein